MTSTLTRLQNLEADLTPKQVIFRQLAQMAKFDNLDDFLRWAYTDDALAQMPRTAQNMYDAVKRRVSGKDSREMNRACRQAYREFQFLFDLAMQPCKQMETDKYRFLFSVSTLAHWLGSLWRAFKDEGKDGLLEDLRQAKRLAEPLLVELVSNRLTYDAIARKYLDGKPLLFKQQHQLLARLTAHVEQMIEHLNEAVDLVQLLGENPEVLQSMYIDVEVLQAMAEKKVAARVEQAEQEARIALYGAEDKHDDALRLCQRMIYPQ